MRIVSYDSYQVTDEMGEVAKPHYDIGGFTMQAYADAAGFWGSPDGAGGQKIYHDTVDGVGALFTGMEYRKLYGKDGRFTPLWHGVNRVYADGSTTVPKRHSIILFMDAPRIDCKTKPQEVLPYVHEALTNESQVA